MSYKLFAGILLLAAQNVFASDYPLVIIEPFDDARIIIYVSETDIEKSPAWKPTNGTPPLTIEKLIADIQKHIASDPRLANAIIHEIELKPILHHEKENRWYYLIQMKIIDNQRPTSRYLAVLMNGKILSAIKEPKSYK